MLNTGLFLLATALAFPAEAPAATCSLPTDGKQIRQFAFDGDPETYFASLGNASRVWIHGLTERARFVFASQRVTSLA